MAFQKMNVESSRKYTSDDVFFTVNRFNGGYLSAGLRNLLGAVNFLDIEYDAEIKVLRFKVADEGTPVKAGLFKLSPEIRNDKAFTGYRIKHNTRYAVSLKEDGWWYLDGALKR